ncbi:hypothetical protein LAZ67_5004313, partial [Cordylochernes scorpioides]
MEEETKIEHVIGGLKKEYSFALYLNPPKTTDDLLVVCKKMDSFEKKYRERVEKSRNLYNGPRYSRPQQQSRYVPPTAARNYQTTSRPQAPVSNNYKNDSPPTPRQYRNNFPQPSTPRRPYNPNFVPKPNLQRNTYNKSQEVSKNRTEDGRPICFKCNKPGHVARYCRVKFIRILEEDPADTQEKVEEKCQMNEISEKSGPRLYADIGTFEALVDTGADLSVVDLRTALDTGHGISKLAKICAGPDGKKLDMVGSIFLNIKIDDETLSHNFVILKTHLRTLILGRDFLKKMNAKIDCKQETIKYDLTNNHDEINFQMLKIKSAKDSIVPECSMKLIKALVETEDGEYIIEESSKMFQTNGLRLARSLINVINRETHIWITNPYPRPLKIMKNQTLAFGSSPAKINVSREREVEKNEEPRFQINENLSPKEQKELKQVLERYGDLFSSRLERTNLAKHWIDTEDAKPIKHKPYRVSAKERDIIKEQIDEMLTEGIIRSSSSPWSFPVILVKKRDGKYRFCVDYRKLNNVTVKDVYPIPRIDEVMDTLQGSTHFSAIDLRSGYWQVEVEERDKEKTAFTTAHGLYEFNVMPFGLCNAPATFERNMENMLGNLRWQICLCYLDDVIIYSSDFPTHLKRLEAVFRCFRESNLRLNDKKCRFAFEELEILGYITSKHGIKPAEHNIKAVRNFPRPKKVKEVQSFLGMCSYYRKFIKDFSKIADPLTNLIKKSVSFTWTERQEEAFQTLKTALLSPPILGHFNPNAPTYVHTDASNIGIGATLVQDIGGEEKVISYLSHTLSKAEQNYSTTEKECLAVVWSMSKLRPYLYGRHFKIVTDHHALCWLKNLKDPTGRLARWALKIQEFDFDIIHKSGKKHLDADGLSRGPLPETDWDEDFERLFLNQITDEEDKFIESVKKNLNGSRRSIAKNFKEEDGCLFKKNPNPEGRAWLLVVPEYKKREIMKEYHNHMSNGHLGVARTMYRIKSKYLWPSMLKDVSEFVKTCHLCQSRKGSNQLPSGLLQPIPPANFPFERIGIDFVGPLPSTKNRKKWIIVLSDYYTRYAETRAVSEATVKEVSKFLVEDIFLRHGAPQYLISDRGSQFTSNLMKEVMKTCKIKHCFTTSYHPQTNGLTERLNRTLINMLSMYVNTDQKNWDEILPFITHAYNTTIQETTGYSPFFLMFGREPTSLLDDRNISVDIDKDDYDEYIKHHLDKINRTRKLVINNTIKTQERMKKNYDKKHMERSYEPGKLVAVWTPIRKIGKCEKLLRKYFGPYRILEKLSNVNYLIEPKDNPGQDPLIVHVSRIKPYFERIDEVNHEDDDIGGLDKDDHILIRNYTPKYKNKSSVYIESKEIEETILKTNIKKAPGPDYISNNMIRQAKIKIIPILHKLFNKCIEMGYYPDEWKKSFLKIIPKPGKTNYEINKSYRPISLTSNLSKTFENIIKNKLSNYYLENNLMSSRQHGFMKSRSTITGMDKIIETILKHKQKELTSLIAIDIAGAFDNAWWPAIIKRMDNDDVPSDLIRIIKSYLNNEREVKFTYESETFYKKLTKGCPQGGPLSPLLWNILLNDLLINFDSMNADIICYADDVTIICWNKTIEGLKTASEYTLNYVIQWCNRNKLTISTEKTNMLYLHNRQKIPIKVNNNIIMPVKQVKILGMKFSNHKWKNKVNFTPHVNDILCKAGRMKNLLCSLSGNMWGLDTEKRLTLFKTIIRPVLTYGSEIWFKYLNNRCKQKLNSMQYQIILWAVRAYKTTSSNCVHSLAKLSLLTDYIESRIIKFDLAQMSIEDLITYEPHAPSIVKSFLHAKMNEIFENTNEIFRSFFVLGIPRFFRPNFYNIQFITDHGNFGKFLATIGAVKEPGCFCGGEIQDARHLLLECPIFRDFRENRFGRIGQLDEFVDKKEKYKNFDQFYYGLGVILSHRNDRKEECPIAFASRTSTEAEKRFSQLEKKALSITFGVEKFRQYLLGRKFVLVTDNRPLIHIFSPHKPIPICASSRIKRWFLKLAAFNYTVEFRKTSDNSNVDALSRLPLESSVRESLDEDQVLLRKSNEVPFSFMEVANETPQDKILSIVLRNVREGNWKFTRAPRENPLAPHYKINEELSLVFGCLQWRERV